MADFKREGYGQVEPNHLSAQKTGQIWAQRPAASTISQLENGQFVKYDPKSETAAIPTAENAIDGEWLMVFNEVHTYDERDRYYKDFAMKKSDAVDGVIVPRVIKTNIGDIFTTNTLKAAGSYRANTTMIAEADVATQTLKGAVYTVNADGFLQYNANPGTAVPQFAVVNKTTMADTQAAIKFQRIK